MADKKDSGRRADSDGADEADAKRREAEQREAQEKREAAGGHPAAAQHLNPPPEGADAGVQAGDYGAQQQMRPMLPQYPTFAGNIWDYGGEEPPDAATMSRHAMEREQKMARSRGVDDDTLANYDENTRWFLSNRVDDRVAIFERDPRHPGGELFLAGDAPDRGYLTETAQRLLLNGDIKIVPEPMRVVEVKDHDGKRQKVRNRRFPIETAPDAGIISAAQPGHPTPIGRRLSPDLFDAEDIKQHEREQRGKPRQIPVDPGGIVPKHEDVTRPA